MTDLSIPDKFDEEKWFNDWRPTYHPDWGDGQIHLDGEKDFPVDADAHEVIENFQERCEVVGGLCTHQSEEQTFKVTAQFGELLYTMHYDDEGRIYQIDFREEEYEIIRDHENYGPEESDGPDVTEHSYLVDDIVEFQEEVVQPVHDALESGEIEYSIEEKETVNIMDL